MKISEQPTNHILAKAYTMSDFDSCEYAIITLNEGWADRIGKRVEAVCAFHDDYNFYSVRYRDGSADFYKSDEQMDEVLSDGKEWAFVDLEKDEEEKFPAPESRLDCYALILYTDGSGRYMATGKYTGDEFGTIDLPFGKIVECIRNKTTIKI